MKTRQFTSKITVTLHLHCLYCSTAWSSCSHLMLLILRCVIPTNY